MPTVVDRVEVVHVGRGAGRESKRRLWFDNELVAVDRLSGDTAAMANGNVLVIESVFDGRDTESAYWDNDSGIVLPESRVRLGGQWTRFSPGRSMLDEYAPAAGLPAATLFARFACSGLAIDPGAVFEIDLRLVDGKPVTGARARLPDRPELVLAGSVEELLEWCAGSKRLPELASVSLEAGDVFLLGTVAGTLLMSGGLAVPTRLAAAATALVDLVQDHRGALDEHGPLL